MTSQHDVQIRVRVTRGNEVAIGPGKIDLLAAIHNTGSISGAARSMGMSYRRAWLLVETMNQCFQRPLVETATGGKAGGGATLTAEGEAVLEAFSAMMKDVDAVANRHLSALLERTPLVNVPKSGEG